MNILITSVGRRSYLVKYFKEVIGEKGSVHVSNSNAYSPAFEYADKFTVTPLIYDQQYMTFLKEYCIKHNIQVILSLLDIDLPVLSNSKEEFDKIGVKILVTDIDVINICNDKWKTYQFYKDNNLDTPKTYLTKALSMNAISNGEISFPLIIKPRWGMGSIAVYEVSTKKELDVLYNKALYDINNSYLKYESQINLKECIIIQEKIIGQEYGLDIINNLDGEYKNTVVIKKYSMRSGETDCAETVYIHELKEIGKAISLKLHHILNMDVDVIFDGEKSYILDMNARFGGCYPFCHVAGVNLPLAILKWLNGEEVEDNLLTEEIGIIAHKTIDIIKLSK